LNHKHETRKTHIRFVEFDDVIAEKLALDSKYFGEGNSRNRKLDFDFEYCLSCNLRLIDNEPALTQGILEHEFERFVTQAKKGRHINAEEITVQYSDFESLERLIRKAIEFGKLRERSSYP
jgi:hypothetical protein